MQLLLPIRWLLACAIFATADALRGSEAAAAADERVSALELEIQRLRADLSKARKPADERAPDIWNIASPEGGSDKTTLWSKDKGGGPIAYFFAVIFVMLVGSMPFALHYGRRRRPVMMTKATLVESFSLYVWLIGGLYLFTNVLLFQSPHFSEIRSLTLEESVYLFSQILTTVGYGDITPAKLRGQVFVGVFVFIAILLIANMISELMGIFEERMEAVLGILTPRDTASATLAESSARNRHRDIDPAVERQKVWAAFMPVVFAAFIFSLFVIAGTLFFHLYPGENKSLGQGVYMSFITLSSVGFGAFTPTTHTGMVFGAFWMLFGVGALGGVITSYAAFSKAVKHYEVIMATGKDEDEDNTSSARTRHAMSVKMDTRSGRSGNH